MSEFDKEIRFIQTALEAGRGGLGDLSKALHALKKASTISTIGDLDDIEIDNPQPDQVITYDGETGQWVNGSAVAGDGVYQPVNGNLTALSLLDTSAGVVYQSSENLFGKRVLGTTANTIAAGDHTHTGVYAPVIHDHDATYAASTHYHDDLYSPLGHNHSDSYAILTRLVSTQHSLTGGGDLSADRTISLVNDLASPGNSMVYGTTIAGVKGWKADPAGAGSYTDELAQDAIGTILVDSASINFTYDDATPSITAVAIFGTTATTVCVGNDARLSDARTPVAHDHSANKLAQANTHESVDTDTATTALHHTIGTTATTAAAGNHTHAQLHDSVTVSGTPDYITLSGQQIIRGLVDLGADVSGTLPISNVANLTTATETGATRTNTATDRANWVRWTNTGAKTFTIANSIASDGDVWSGINAAVSGTLTLVAGAGVTLTGSLGFAAGKTYTLRFSAASAADVVGGTT